MESRNKEVPAAAGNAPGLEKSNAPAGTGHYLLLTSIPVAIYGGEVFTEELWVKDLSLHVGYISDLCVACPMSEGAPPANYLPIPLQVARAIKFARLPGFDAKSWQIVRLPLFLAYLGWHLRQARIVHCTVGNHPILYGFLYAWLHRFTRIGTIAVVESSSWRKKLLPLTPGIIPWLAEKMAATCVGQSDVAFLTQVEYRQSLAKNHPNAHVAPAVWLEEANILSADQVLANNALRRELGPDLRVGFFARVEWDKGLDTIIKATRICRDQGVRVVVEAYGDGSYLPECRQQAADLADRIQFRGVVRYGEELFSKIRENHFTVVANKLDEQSRITYDSYSQGVPVIGSSSWGVRTCVQEGVTGFLFEKGSAQDLARVFLQLASDLSAYDSLCLQALQDCTLRSHSRMHASRSQFLAARFPEISLIKGL